MLGFAGMGRPLPSEGDATAALGWNEGTAMSGMTEMGRAISSDCDAMAGMARKGVAIPPEGAAGAAVCWHGAGLSLSVATPWGWLELGCQTLLNGKDWVARPP